MLVISSKESLVLSQARQHLHDSDFEVIKHNHEDLGTVIF